MSKDGSLGGWMVGATFSLIRGVSIISRFLAFIMAPPPLVRLTSPAMLSNAFTTFTLYLCSQAYCDKHRIFRMNLITFPT